MLFTAAKWVIIDTHVWKACADKWLETSRQIILARHFCVTERGITEFTDEEGIIMDGFIIFDIISNGQIERIHAGFAYFKVKLDEGIGTLNDE